MKKMIIFSFVYLVCLAIFWCESSEEYELEAFRIGNVMVKVMFYFFHCECIRRTSSISGC